MRTRVESRAGWRFNVWLTLLLVLGIVVAGNRLARRTLAVRIDLSEDQLFAPSPVAQRLLGELEDVLFVKGFFTGEARLGPVQIAKRRLINQLEEYRSAAGGRLELLFADPNSSSEARVEAHGLGISPVPLSAMQGTSQVQQDAYFGVLLRYRGREEVIPFVLPQGFEFVFLSSLNKLLREETTTVGFLTGNGDGAPDTFTEARALVADQYRVVEVLDLAAGEAIPDDVSVLVVARPRDVHPRTVFAVDRYVQRGGRALFLVDRTLVDPTQGYVERLTTGFAELFAAWGAVLDPELVWDQESCNRISTYETIEVGGAERRHGQVSIPFPFWPNVGPEGLSTSVPVTSRLPGADLFWVSAVGQADLAGDAPDRQPLLTSSEATWIVPAAEALTVDPRALDARGVQLLATGGGRSRELAVVLGGRMPSPFVGRVPAPLDPVEEALYRERLRSAAEAGLEPPEREVRTTDEVVSGTGEPTQVVLFGDSDWATDGRYFNDRNRLLFENLIDWLALEDDLVELRSRLPRERAIADFLDEERQALGLGGLRVEGSAEELGRLSQLEEEAASRAARRRWLYMGAAMGGAFLLALLLGLLWRLAFGRVPRAAGEQA